MILDSRNHDIIVQIRPAVKVKRTFGNLLLLDVVALSEPPQGFLFFSFEQQIHKNVKERYRSLNGRALSQISCSG